MPSRPHASGRIAGPGLALVGLICLSLVTIPAAATPAQPPGLVSTALPSGFGAHTLAADGNGVLVAGTVGAHERCATVSLGPPNLGPSAPAFAPPPLGGQKTLQPCAREVTANSWLVVTFKSMDAVTLALAVRATPTAPLHLGPVVATLKGNWDLAHDGDVVAANGLAWVYDDDTRPMSVLRVSTTTGRVEGRFPVPGLGYDPRMAADVNGLWIGPSQGWAGGKGARLYRVGPEAKRSTVALRFNGALQWLDAAGYRLWAGVVAPPPRLSESVWLLDGARAKRAYSTPAPRLPGPEVAYAMVGDLAQGLYTLGGDLSAPVDSDDCSGHLDVVRVDPSTGEQRVVARVPVHAHIPWVPCGNSLGDGQAAIVGHKLYFLWDIGPESEGGYTRLYELNLGRAGESAPRHALARVSSTTSAPDHPGANVSRRASSVTGAIVTPEQPDALTFGPNGELYVVDAARDQVLASASPYHAFRVVAGSGTRGFSGDGGPADRAKLDLSRGSGIAVGPGGTVYIVDSSNRRVREVLPNGKIQTVAGGGKAPLGQRPVPALHAQFNPSSVTIGPNGALFLAARQGVYELTRQGMLDWVIGEQLPLPSSYAWDGDPAVQNDFQPADRVAFDRKGDLFVAGGGAYGLYERTTSGALRFVGVDRGPGGYLGAIATGSNDSVLAAAGYLSSYSPRGRRTSVPDALSSILGPMPHPILGDKDWQFVVGTGVAVGPNGDIFVDASTGTNTASLVPAMARIAPDGRTSLVWRGPVPSFTKSM